MLSSRQYKSVKVSGIRFIIYININISGLLHVSIEEPTSGKMEGEILSCVKGLKHPEALCGITRSLGQGFPCSPFKEPP